MTPITVKLIPFEAKLITINSTLIFIFFFTFFKERRKTPNVCVCALIEKEEEEEIKHEKNTLIADLQYHIKRVRIEREKEKRQ